MYKWNGMGGGLTPSSFEMNQNSQKSLNCLNIDFIAIVIIHDNTNCNSVQKWEYIQYYNWIKRDNCLTCGKWKRRGANNTNTHSITRHENKPAICVLPPIRSWSVLLDSAADAGNVEKKDEKTLAAPKAINSWLASTSYLLRFAKILAKDKDMAKVTVAIITLSYKTLERKSSRGALGVGSLSQNEHRFSHCLCLPNVQSITRSTVFRQQLCPGFHWNELTTRLVSNRRQPTDQLAPELISSSWC